MERRESLEGIPAALYICTRIGFVLYLQQTIEPRVFARSKIEKSSAANEILENFILKCRSPEIFHSPLYLYIEFSHFEVAFGLRFTSAVFFSVFFGGGIGWLMDSKHIITSMCRRVVVRSNARARARARNASSAKTLTTGRPRRHRQRIKGGSACTCARATRESTGGARTHHTRTAPRIATTE